MNLIKTLKDGANETARGLGHGIVSAKQRIGTGIVAATAAIVPASAFAADQNIGQVAKEMGSNASGLAEGALSLAAFVGVVMVIIALVKGRNAKQQGESVGSYVAMGLIGALLFSVPTLISIFTMSSIGSDTSQGMQGSVIGG